MPTSSGLLGERPGRPSYWASDQGGPKLLGSSCWATDRPGPGYPRGLPGYPTKRDRTGRDRAAELLGCWAARRSA